MKLTMREWSGRRPVRKDMRLGEQTEIWQKAKSKVVPLAASAAMCGEWPLFCR
jgi:hypothetical protein